MDTDRELELLRQIEALTVMRGRADLLISECYTLLLRVPYTSPVRTISQSAMARCVDYLAERNSMEPEAMQVAYETMVNSLERIEPIRDRK